MGGGGGGGGGGVRTAAFCRCQALRGGRSGADAHRLTAERGQSQSERRATVDYVRRRLLRAARSNNAGALMS